MEFTQEKLNQIVSAVEMPDRDAMDRAEKRQAELAKPPVSLGTLEQLSIQLAGITGKVKNSITKKELLVFLCG